MFFIYFDNLKHGRLQLGVILLISLQIIFYCLSEFIGNLRIDKEYPLHFIPALFSIKPFVYSYTLITATFLHTGFWHLFGNVMFFLAIARTLERLFGTTIFLSSYLLIGALAYLGDWLISPNSITPIVGSSGAVAFLMGVYLMLFPSSKLRLFVTMIVFYRRFWIPAYVFLLVWFFLQTYDFVLEDGNHQVAYATHIFGFILGTIVAMAWKELAVDTERKIEELKEEIQ